MNKGFTLIELLVVVLIIGILAAIALPQYVKAVERSRTAEAIQRLGDLATAQQVWYMQHGSFAGQNDVANMDIAFADLDTPSYTVTVTGGTTGIMQATRRNGQFEGNTLTLTVNGDGSIEKVAGGTKDLTQFRELVASAGYGS